LGFLRASAVMQGLARVALPAKYRDSHSTSLRASSRLGALARNDVSQKDMATCFRERLLRRKGVAIAFVDSIEDRIPAAGEGVSSGGGAHLCE
jgi:hypothetical protein